jgi:hypothetical protein
MRSLVSPLLHLLREPLRRAERSVVMLLPLAPPSSLYAGRRSSPCSSPPLHVGSAASTLEAKPRRHSLVTRPPELHHCRPYSGESRATTTMVPPTSIARPYPIFSPRADRLRERYRGHQCRWVAPAIPRPNWRLPEDRVHTSHLPDRSTPFLHDISSRMPTTTPAPTVSPRTRSPSEPSFPTHLTDGRCRNPAGHRRRYSGRRPSPASAWVVPVLILLWASRRRRLCGMHPLLCQWATLV